MCYRFKYESFKAQILLIQTIILLLYHPLHLLAKGKVLWKKLGLLTNWIVTEEAIDAHLTRH